MIGGNVLDGRYFAGLIDEVAYYPAVLSIDRIEAHYRAGRSSSATGVPALDRWALASLIALLALAGIHESRRERR